MSDLRKIVKPVIIDSIEPIENADAIELAKIGGWSVVTQKNRFNVGSTAIFFEIDAFLPEDQEIFSSFTARGRKVAVNPHGKEVGGHVLKTARLRGVYSQGLLLTPNEFGVSENPTNEEVSNRAKELGVFKWEPPLPTGGEQVGAFPSSARKTDSERIQNLTDEFLQSLNPNEWRATEKIDGTSSTFVMGEEGLTVASRNWAVNPDSSLQGQIAKRLNLHELLPVGAVLQGEVFGEGIQGNPLKIQGTRLMVFSHNLSKSEISPELQEILEKNAVPEVTMTLPRSVDEAVEQVNGIKSLVNPKVNAEGVVWWNILGTLFEETGDRPNFKCINNKFLLKNG